MCLFEHLPIYSLLILFSIHPPINFEHFRLRSADSSTMLASERSRRVVFENRVLTFMLLGNEDKAASLLGQTELAENCDLGMLLQKAAERNNVKVARRLMELGADVDCLTPHGNTPLTIAINGDSVEAIEVLLAANASIDVAGARGESALQAVLRSSATNRPRFFRSTKRFETLQAFIRGAKSRGVESFADKLIAVGSSLFQAAFFDDVEVLECMLNRGLRVDSKGPRGMTALHGTAVAGHLRTAEWLVDKGADVNAEDDDGRSPLFVAALSCDKSMMRFLLERGADPNSQERETESAPLLAVFASACDLFCTAEVDMRDVDDCVEILLHHGATLRNSTKFVRTIFDCALRTEKCIERIHFVIARLAMLEMKLGCDLAERREEKTKFEKYFERCRKVLTVEVFDKLSLVDLLNASERNMMILVRKETFASAIEKVCTEQKLKELHLYYYKTLFKRVSDGTDMLELEVKAITVISKIFSSNYNLCYDFGRKVIEYLNKRELEQFCQVYE